MRRSTFFVFLFAGVLALGIPTADRGADTIPDAPTAGHGRIGVYLTSYAVTKEDTLREVLIAQRDGLINTLVINVKNMHGEVTYDCSVPLANQIGATVVRADLERLLPALKERGFYLIARQVLFYDPMLSEHLGTAQGWVPANDPVAVAYNLAIAEEVAGLGFDEIQFDYVRFPDGGDLVPEYDERYAAVNAFLAEARQRLSGRIALSADIFGRVLWEWNKRRIDPIGQSLEDISAAVDFVSPMIYPSHYFEQIYKDDPYLVVSDAFEASEGRYTSGMRPFLQAFDRYLPAGMSLETYIREQVRAAVEHGADGYLFWNPSCDYAPLYRALDG